MAHPYATTIPGLVSAIRQLRTTFPATVNADTLKKWSIAPNNEGPVLVVLRYLGLIDDEGKKQADSAKVFVEHDDAEFASKFEGLVKKAYSDLFENWGDKAWTLERAKLIGFFRTADETSARVGTQQAATFTALAALAGHGDAPAEAKTSTSTTKRTSNGKTSRAKMSAPTATAPNTSTSSVTERAGSGATQPTLTVRIEIHLPVSDKQEVYDSIFRSIRANLLNEPSSK